MYKRRIFLATLVMVWLLMLMMIARKGPQENSSEVQSLYREITRALHKKHYYGHDILAQNTWYFHTHKNKLTSLDFPFIINGDSICGSDVKPLLLILVMSLHKKTEQRKAIRETYGRPARGYPWPGSTVFGDVRMVFMFGDSKTASDRAIIEQEAKLYRDVVLVNFTESYYNLTYKVLMAMKWTETYCPQAQFIMKVDEDTFVDIPRITNMLVSINLTNRIYGHFHYADYVERKGKSEVAINAYPMSKYAPHVKGNIYIMPAKLGISIMHLAQYLPYVNMEDAHVTGTLAKLLDVRHHDIPLEQYDPERPPEVCDFALNRKIAGQKVSPSLAYKIWNAIEDPSTCES